MVLLHGQVHVSSWLLGLSNELNINPEYSRINE